MIERLSPTSFRLSGLTPGMYENIDDEAYYGDPDRADYTRDEWRAFLIQQGWDTFVDEAGQTQPWYPGMGYPAPFRRVDDESRPGLERAFFHTRIGRAASKTPEYEWLLSEKLWRYESVLTYSRNGSIIVDLGSKADADRFAEAFSPATV